jgi:hypothetical protein
MGVGRGRHDDQLRTVRLQQLVERRERPARAQSDPAGASLRRRIDAPDDLDTGNRTCCGQVEIAGRTTESDECDLHNFFRSLDGS